jgi:hypothetical protein
MSKEIKLYGGDIALQGGQFHLIDKGEKLEQQSLKIILSDKNFNIFHPNYGASVNSLVGRYMGVEDIGDSVIQKTIKDALVYYQGIQAQQENSQTMDDEEVLLKVRTISVTRPRPDIISIDIQTTDRKGQNFDISTSQAVQGS